MPLRRRYADAFDVLLIFADAAAAAAVGTLLAVQCEYANIFSPFSLRCRRLSRYAAASAC